MPDSDRTGSCSQRPASMSSRMRTRRSTGCGHIAMQRVIHHHAIGIEAPAERADCSLHALDPAARNAVLIALIVERNDFVAKDSIKVAGISSVVNIGPRVSSSVSNGETV